MHYLGLCLTCKDENVYLDEWLRYHFALGVDRIFIVDNNSAVPIAASIREWIESGKVAVAVDCATSQGRQCRTYARFLKEQGEDFQWIGFIDTDEFLVPKETDSLPEFLQKYESFGGLGVFWHCFGSNGHAVRQSSVVRAFTKRAADNWGSNNHIKSIVQPRHTIPVATGDPHHFHYAAGFCCVDEKGAAIEGARRWPRTSEKIQLNHYITRSREECERKIERGSGNSAGNLRSPAFFAVHDAACNAVADTSIVELVERLRSLSRLM